jgi:hypothetical protein
MVLLGCSRGICGIFSGGELWRKRTGTLVKFGDFCGFLEDLEWFMTYMQILFRN